MKKLFRWFAKIIASSITIILVFVALPYAQQLAAWMIPDESGAAIKASAVIASRLESSARLETLRVSEDGVLNYAVKPAFLPTVAEITAKYSYEASFGVDLQKVSIQLTDGHMIFELPPAELIQDSLTPVEVYRDDFWYPWIDDEKYEQLFEEERLVRREAYIGGDKHSELWTATVEAFEGIIFPWMQELNTQLTFSCVEAASQ